MNIGEKIVHAIVQGQLVRSDDPYCVIIWHPSSAEQLEAVVEAHIQEEVRKRVYIELSVKKAMADVDDHLDDKGRKTIQDYIDKKYPDVAPPYPDPPAD